MTDHIIKAAREAELLEPSDVPATVPNEYISALERFYAIAFNAGMERAAEICDEQMASGQLAPLEQHRASFIACVIRAHAQNQPKTTHDGSVV